jgi:hypothetical protein
MMQQEKPVANLSEHLVGVGIVFCEDKSKGNGSSLAR